MKMEPQTKNVILGDLCLSYRISKTMEYKEPTTKAMTAIVVVMMRPINLLVT
jgi:hypothetical protein